MCRGRGLCSVRSAQSVRRSLTLFREVRTECAEVADSVPGGPHTACDPCSAARARLAAKILARGAELHELVPLDELVPREARDVLRDRPHHAGMGALDAPEATQAVERERDALCRAVQAV